MNTQSSSRAVAAAVLAGVLLLAGCGDQPSTQEDAKGRAPKAHLVEVVAAAAELMAYSAERTGTLRAGREVRIHTQEEGRIVALPRYEGDRVAEGEVVARLDGTLLRAELDKAEANRRQAELDLKRLQGLSAKRLAAEEELARARTALQVARSEEALLRARLGYTEIRAPFAGLVAERLAEPGDIAVRHAHLLTLFDPGSLMMEARVSELLIPALAVGDAVAMRIDALGDAAFEGVIRRIHPTVDPATRLGTVEIALEPPPEGARPGQLARARLSGHAERRLAVPFHALQRDAEGEYLYIVDDEGLAHRRAVRSGLRLAERVAVLEGVAEGEWVVVKGFLGLSDGANVRVVGEGRRTEKTD